MDLDPGPSLAAAYYEAGVERPRLSSGPGLLERERTQELLERYLPPAPARVADIGSGPGCYSLWLAERGYAVTARDLMPLHVAQLREAAEQGGLTVDAAVADARRLDLPDQGFDAVLLLGPLYHLQERAGRLQALREAARVVAPGGVVIVVAISRWAVILDGMLRLRLTETQPGFLAIVDEEMESGRLNPVAPGGFSGFCHRPVELEAEVTEVGLRPRTLLSIEGPGAYLVDVDERWATLAGQALLLDVARRLEAVPELAGMGSHLMLVAERQG